MIKNISMSKNSECESYRINCKIWQENYLYLATKVLLPLLALYQHDFLSVTNNFTNHMQAFQWKLGRKSTGHSPIFPFVSMSSSNGFVVI